MFFKNKIKTFFINTKGNKKGCSLGRKNNKSGWQLRGAESNEKEKNSKYVSKPKLILIYKIITHMQ